MSLLILRCSFYNDKEGLPRCVFIMDRGVPPQGGLVSEGPSAGIAHERLLPSVYAMVTLQRVELRELLPTLVTAIGPFTCVNFYMLVKGISLCKRSEANFTFKRLGSRMDSVVVLQVLLRGKALPTCFTHKRSFPCVTSFVIYKHVILSEPGTTFITDKRLFPSMDSEMRKQH